MTTQRRFRSIQNRIKTVKTVRQFMNKYMEDYKWLAQFKNSGFRRNYLNKYLIPLSPPYNSSFTKLAFPGVYILYRGLDIVYIGKSTRTVSTRIASHTRKEWKFDKVEAYKITNNADIDIAEVYLITLHNPKYNVINVYKEPPTLKIPLLDDIINTKITLNLHDLVTEVAQDEITERIKEVIKP